MKKIICFILAISCIFCFASCNEKDVDPNQVFFDTVAASKPLRIKTIESYAPDGETPLTGLYETVMSDEGFVFTYSFQRYAVLGDEENDNVVVNGNIATVAGAVHYKDGRYSEDGVNWGSAAPDNDALRIKLNLDKELLGSYTIDENKTSITATVSAEDAEEILGLKLTKASSDIMISVTTNGTYLNGVVVTYLTENATVTISTSYTYS